MNSIVTSDYLKKTTFINEQKSTSWVHFRDDLIHEFFRNFQAKNDYESISNLSRINIRSYKIITALLDAIDLLKVCPKLTILEINLNDMPRVSKSALIHCYNDLVPHVECDNGITVIPMRKDNTLRKLAINAHHRENRLSVDLTRAHIPQDLMDIPIKESYLLVITNSVFKESRNLEHAKKVELADKYRCKIPTIEEIVALHFFRSIPCPTKDTSYPAYPFYCGAITSTKISEERELAYLGFDFNCREIRVLCSNHFDLSLNGVGGRRKFG